MADTIPHSPVTGSANNSMMEIIIVGDPHVGKTRLGARMLENELVQIDLKINAINVVGNSGIMQTYDIERQMKYRSKKQSYFRNMDAVVYIYDITNQASFEGIKQWLIEFKEDRGVKYLVGNKSDLEKERVVSTLLGAELAVEHGLNFREISAEANINCTELLLDIVNDFKEKSMECYTEDAGAAGDKVSKEAVEKQAKEEQQKNEKEKEQENEKEKEQEKEQENEREKEQETEKNKEQEKEKELLVDIANNFKEKCMKRNSEDTAAGGEELTKEEVEIQESDDQEEKQEKEEWQEIEKEKEQEAEKDKEQEKENENEKKQEKEKKQTKKKSCGCFSWFELY